MNKKQVSDFQKNVWEHYQVLGRDLPWRHPEADGTYDPYKILVSEIMLQQTQVSRVVEKYKQFLMQFPRIQNLAEASLADVLQIWNGLGYNRRAMFLRDAAGALAKQGQPWTLTQLLSCKGIGVNTAAAVLCYSYNEPRVFIETNIRTVYIHHFFPAAVKVPDTDIAETLNLTLDMARPREFYWALMDYGSYLKTQGNKSAQKSKIYSRQTKFDGSRRQVRGMVIRYVTARGSCSFSELKKIMPDERLTEVVEQLTQEGLLQNNQGKLTLGS